MTFRLIILVVVGMLSTSCHSQSEGEIILSELQKLNEAITNQNTELGNKFETMKQEIREEVGNMINDAKLEWQGINNTTRNDVSTLSQLLDTDECSDFTHNCSSDATCIDTRVSFRCQCKPGFTGDGYTCTDIDECRERYRCGRHATCSNTPGSYKCSCNQGFTGEGRDCEDVDECSRGTHNCHQYAVCTNTVGSFRCTCTLFHEGDGIECRESDVLKNCTGPFKAVPGVGCIHIIERSQSFYSSKSDCRDLGGELFVAINADHYLRLAKHFIDTNQASRKKYMWVGVKEGVWLSGRKVSPKEEAPRNPTMGPGTCSYTDGDTSEKFLLWTDPCSEDWWALCEKKIGLVR